MATILTDRFIVLLGFFIAVVLIKRSFTRPIYSLLGEINKVRGGDYSPRAAVISDDEIGELTQNFNQMVKELELSHSQLKEYSRTLEKKVAERTREIQEKNSELEETLERLKQMQKQVIVQEKMASLGQLVAGLTHEMNTPIGAIRSIKNTQSKAVLKLQKAVEKLGTDSFENSNEIDEILQIILNADQVIDQGTNRLNELIKNLKIFARLDEAETAKADIHEALDSVLALIRHELLNEIEVVREYGNIPLIVCHARKLNQVFLNLIKNACQAIDGKGTITITTKMIKNKVHVAIRDTGKGIGKENLTSIFDPGFATKDASVRASLGLSTSYQIIQEHHGEIRVESELGRGAVFTVILPIEFSNDTGLV
jgi:signal transduction histidine kinase